MSENLPFISVVIPTCDRHASLDNAIESIITNHYPHYEIIVVDQSSGSETRTLMEKNFSENSNIIYLHSAVKCSSDSRNNGWKRAKGEIIAFTDDDAVVGELWLKSIADAFKDPNEKVGIVGGPIKPVFESPRPPWLPPAKDYLLPGYDLGDKIQPFPKNDLPITVNAAFLRSILEEVGGFDTRLGLKKGGDNPYIGGEDSFIGKQVLEKGYIILYHPFAVVFHPVPSERLKRLFFLKRNYREGVTTIALENTKTPCSSKRLSGHIKYHFKSVCWNILLFIKEFSIPQKGRSKAYMLTASRIAFSLGVIRYSRYLRKKINSHSREKWQQNK